MRKGVWLLVVSAAVWAQDWALIVHPGFPAVSLTPMQIRAVYLGQRRFIDGIRLIPLQLPADEPLRAQFEKEILAMPRSRVREWWIRQHYLGRRPPKVMGSAEGVAAFVEREKGAVGYVPTETAEEYNVTIVYENPEIRP